MTSRDDGAPPPRSETVRQAIREALSDASLTAHEISEVVGIREREVAAHLASIERSAKHHGERLVVEPARCEPCGFVFQSREKLTAPSRCPKCKSERIHPPSFRLKPL
jgi:predicted Zn-ribbon and HTH transcriptional regulator